jgi:hypothetical protein
MPTTWDMLFGADPNRSNEFRKFTEMRIDALNHALKGIPEDRIRYYVCCGSWNGPHTTDVPLKDVVDFVLKVNAQAYAIEGAKIPDTSTNGEFGRRRNCPKARSSFQASSHTRPTSSSTLSSWRGDS